MLILINLLLGQMKVNYSLESLNQSFERIKSNPKGFDTGSITPRTTTDKVICDEVKISPEALKLYQQSISERANKTFLNLSTDREQELKKIVPLKELLSIDKSDKLFEQKLQDVDKKVDLAEKQIAVLKNSFGIQIKHDSGFSFETVYQEGVRENEAKISITTPAVIRYGLDTEGEVLHSIVGSYIEKGVLHPYEQALFQRAFDYLKPLDSADYYIKSGDKSEYPNNVVLVDIFDRSKGFINEGHNQTHTIALWKKKDAEFVLIDPSNVSFSSDIAKILKINSMSVPGNQVYFPGNSKTGYSNYAEVLPKPRDCIDISVKIGFELNELQKQQVGIKEIENILLDNIANTKAANRLIRAIGLDQCYVREFQSSNQQIRTESRNTILENGNFIKSMSRLDSITQYKKVLEIVTKANSELELLNVKVCPTKDIPSGKVSLK